MAAVRLGVYWGDPLLAERALERALAALGPVRKVVLFGDEPVRERLLAELGAVDLFGEGRAIVVRRADPLLGEAGLERALARGLPPDTALFLLGADLRALARRADDARGFPAPTGRALQELAAELLGEAGLPTPPFLLDLLVEACGGDTLRLAREVEKLALWKGTRLPPEDLSRILFFSGGAPYSYLDAVGGGDVPAALRELRRLLEAGANPGALFFALVGHVRALLAALAAEQGGRTPAGPPWLVRRRLAQARRWGETALVGLLAQLQELDRAVKTGQLSPEAALYRFTLGLPGRG
ncbi:MAG: hypothetical protein N2320_03120 [Candidatus Bipolaricaulota bacterium]|nr:hypothetical protein [Candidatus Bipolaricaulota bacterium]